MPVCDVVLSDGKICGIETQGRFCGLHSLGAIQLGNEPELVQYAGKRNRSFLDLSGRRFVGFRFLREHLEGYSDVRFDRTTFEDCQFFSVSLRNPTFDDAVIRNTLFECISVSGEKATFEKSRFEGTTKFIGPCKFQLSDSISFSNAHFDLPKFPFSGVYIDCPNANFSDSTFNCNRFAVSITSKGNEKFDRNFIALHSSNVSFRGFRCSGHFEFTNYPDSKEESPSLSFQMVNFTQMDSATFIEANLLRSSFLFSIIDNVYFVAPKWPELGRLLLYDEIDLRRGQPGLDHLEREEINQLCQLYIQMKANYEARRDFIGASDWHLREMECRKHLAVKRNSLAEDGRTKLASPPLWMCLRYYHFASLTTSVLHAIKDGTTLVLFWLYRYSSRYGENYVRPLWLLIGLWLFASVLHSVAGFPVSGTIEGHQVSSPGGVPSESSHDFMLALLYSANVMMLQSNKNLVLTTGQSFIQATQVLLSVILLSLFLLALRRRFKR